ncbi:hypothetical protein HB881_05620 [Listeria booriae]|nr:hypothetical protein [Listeria booriae]
MENKLYPVFSGEYTVVDGEKIFQSYRIIDDFGGLSIYESIDFIFVNDSLEAYSQKVRGTVHEFIHELINYPNFYEDYYNDTPKSRRDLELAKEAIYREDCSKDELMEFICDNNSSYEEKLFILKALQGQIIEDDIVRLVKYFDSDALVRNDYLVKELFSLLGEYRNEKVYQLFLNYFSEAVGKDSKVDELITTYFDNYYH